MVKRILSFIIVISIVFVSYPFLSSCKACKKTSPVKTQRIAMLSEAEKEFQEAMTVCERMKAQVEKHNKIYNESLKRSGSILDEDLEQDAAKQVLEKARELLHFTESCLKSETVIRRVSNAANQYSEYKRYAVEKIRDFRKLVK